jgi:hypothetical protein
LQIVKYWNEASSRKTQVQLGISKRLPEWQKMLEPFFCDLCFTKQIQFS